MFFDPVYLIILGVGFVLSMGAQAWVKSAFSRWSQVPTSRGLTGQQVAQAILDARGIRDVGIEQVQGVLSDHYDPSAKMLRLSPDIYNGRSVAAAGIAAHEVGHAIQHQEGYAMMKLRQKMVPVASIGTNLGLWITIAGIVIGISGLATVGIVLFGGAVAFTLVTLPVEFDASARAKRVLDEQGFVTGEEARGVAKVLNAAAATYVAAAVAAVLQLVYWAWRAGLIGGRR
ncbi:hypothetical protein DV096_10805 [Bradymonadaceae bacterium TMQ3]|uniref:Zinc metallopeptidase n=1 Tax=Lujinxingia sediminis TaxID=2480984 RepID=A0ABY0CRS8_9DELT|nr:zinc metallopeptidase [Lujinxingia sediminis]RDV38288.1 hypothetical protein DV096_10805 [Bradymonadaceae bacterium TMQ3]RVU43509.1 zinc metallopeptidase [Lujinxingia sediminis]TXC75962.1 zinc metallopeptidase [Bradymonadales bacterium TMQ1]